MDEEFEHIPWSELNAAADQRRNRVLYLAAGALVVLAVGVIGARAMLRPEPAPITLDTVAADPAAVAPAGPTDPPPTVLPPTTQPLFSEADLMAVLPDGDAGLAATRAEWFVTDFFTADLDPAGAGFVRDALPAGELPLLAQEAGADAVSFVEWARALDTELLEPGFYRVAVVFRAIGASADGGFHRLPVRAVDVVVRVEPGGATGVAELPIPRPVPTAAGLSPWPIPNSATPAPALAEQALAAARAWGADPRIESTAAAGGGWRIVVSVADEVGNRWPLALWYDSTGAATSPLSE